MTHRWRDSLPLLMTKPSLATAASLLTEKLMTGEPDLWRYADFAAAHIRAVRKQIEAEHGITSARAVDWAPTISDEGLLWGALKYVALAGQLSNEPESVAYYLRLAEAALRTLWRRGQA